MRIDSHQHFWKIERGDYGWITPELPPLYRDYLPEHLLPHLEKHEIDGSIVVQAASTLAETEYILSLSDQSERVLGVVGWLDLTDPAYREHYMSFSKHPKFLGVRLMIQELEDANVILEPAYMEAVKWLADRNCCVDLLVTADQLGPVVKLLERVPHLRCVIDHIAKPQIANGVLEPWSSQLSEIAAHSNVYCKLSGMVTEADPHAWQTADFLPYIRHVLHCFGSERVMFGSDWPVCLLSAGYDEVLEVLESGMPEEYTQEEREKLFGRNAADFYRLPL